MNIALFLTPKRDVVTLDYRHTIKEAMDIMEAYRYTSVPVLDQKGCFHSTLSEGDILWYMKDYGHRTLNELSNKSIKKIQRHHNIQPVSIDASMESLIDLVSAQSFVPVVDDEGIFIGIIKRSDIIAYTTSKLEKRTKSLVS